MRMKSGWLTRSCGRLSGSPLAWMACARCATNWTNSSATPNCASPQHLCYAYSIETGRYHTAYGKKDRPMRQWRAVGIVVCLILMALSLNVSARSRSHGRAGSSARSKTVHVNGYYRSDGTYVHSYDRASPGQG